MKNKIICFALFFILLINIFCVSNASSSLTLEVDNTNFVISETTLSRYKYFLLGSVPESNQYCILLGNTSFEYIHTPLKTVKSENVYLEYSNLTDLNNKDFPLSSNNTLDINSYFYADIVWLYGNCDLKEGDTVYFNANISTSTPENPGTNELANLVLEYMPTTLPDDGFCDYIIVGTNIHNVKLFTFANENSNFPAVTFNSNSLQLITPALYTENENYVVKNKKIAGVYDLNVNSKSWELDSGMGGSYYDNATSPLTWGFTPSDVLYSSVDIYESNSNIYSQHFVTDNVVFTLAPVPFTPMNLVKVEELKEGAKMITTTIAPICLAIFGILLLLFLIRSKKLLNF